MRPIYETEKDLQREQAIAERVAAAWGGEMVKLIPRYSIDYVFIHDGECAAWVEIKSRTVASTTYPTYYASLHTVMFGKQMAAETGLPFFFGCFVVGHNKILAGHKELSNQIRWKNRSGRCV